MSLTILEENRAANLERLFELIRIPSISTDPKWADDCIAAADWLVNDLNSIGFQARHVSTGGHPFVIAHSPKLINVPHVLFYGHYDVQPVDPLALWEREPFDPEVVERAGVKVIHGRGAADDKGQIMTFIEACRAHMAAGGLDLNITILIEGEEETGSPSLPAFLKQYGDEIRADFVLICDTSMVDRDTPSISSQLRGLVGEIITIKAANTDLHSGYYGGAARNPAHVMVEALASLRNKDGSINLPGFYDDVSEISAEIARDWQALEQKGKDLLQEVDLSIPAGENGRSILEQIWARPTMEINGITSGYTGEGFKTVLPAQASAKVSFRLVGAQDPQKIRDSFRAAMRKFIPDDCEIEFHAHGGSPASHMDTTKPEFQKAKAALKGLWKNDAVFVGMGGSIPIVGSFKTVLGMDSMLIGFGLASDQIHAPNEKYDLASFEKGAIAWHKILESLSISD